jgi:O-antigen chain-terminating methyltransferase
MIESNNPEINVDELMVKIREEVARRRENYVPPSPPLSQPQDSVPTAIEWSRVSASLQAAEYQARHVGDMVPGWAHFGRVKRKIAQQVARVILYLSNFVINQQKQVNITILGALRDIGDGLESLERRQKDEVSHALNILREAVGRGEQEQRAALQRLEAELGRREERIQGVEQEQRAALQRLEAELGRREERIQGVEQEQRAALQRLEAEFVQHQERTQGVTHEVREVQATLQRLAQEQRAALQRLETELTQRQEREKELERTLYQLKINLIQQERRITLLLEEARKRLPEPFDHSQLRTLVNEDQHKLDALYVSFEDQFRGTREDIKERLRVYLPLLKENGIGTEHMPIVDVGCGRGEWLEVLREERLMARGVDINRVLVEACRQRGFDVVEDDALASLRGVPDASVGAVTGFHLIEHLPFGQLIALFDEAVRVLKSGGVAIFETPNPQNLQVGACNFYFDPTHRNPLPSPTVRFLAEARGLCRVEVWNLHPFSERWKLQGSELAHRFNDFFYGPQDYAVVGWKI